MWIYCFVLCLCWKPSVCFCVRCRMVQISGAGQLMVAVEPRCRRARATVMDLFLLSDLWQSAEQLWGNVLDIKSSCHYISFLISGRQHIKQFFSFSYDSSTFLLFNANAVLNTCYQNSGYFDKVCSNQKGIILFIVAMMERQGAAVTCQPMNYKWILSWKLLWCRAHAFKPNVCREFLSVEFPKKNSD